MTKLARPADMLDPDVLFLLTNERTLLAWIRTALAVQAGGLAFTQIGNKTSAQITLGLTVTLLGAFMAVIGYHRYRRADRAIRAGHLPAVGYGPEIQVVGTIFLALTLVATHLLKIW